MVQTSHVINRKSDRFSTHCYLSGNIKQFCVNSQLKQGDPCLALEYRLEDFNPMFATQQHCTAHMVLTETQDTHISL